MMQRIMVENCTVGRFPFQERTEKWGDVRFYVHSSSNHDEDVDDVTL